MGQVLKPKKSCANGLLRLWIISKASSNIDRQVHDASAAHFIFLWRNGVGSCPVGCPAITKLVQAGRVILANTISASIAQTATVRAGGEMARKLLA